MAWACVACVGEVNLKPSPNNFKVRETSLEYFLSNSMLMPR